MHNPPLNFALALLIAATSAFAGEPGADARIRQVENNLLPRVALKENLGRPATLAQRMQEFGIPGVSIAVIDGGKIVWTRAYGVSDTVEKTPVTVDTIFQAGSISKPIAALGALRLTKEGKLSLDDNVNAKLKTWRVPDNDFTKDQKVTLRRLMSHTAGLTVHGFPGYAVGSDIPSVVQVLDGQPPANTAPVRVDVIPGSTYRYSGGGYTVMQLLIADVSNESFE
jgi:CubicO group peptidase (beta-lactamase class C family)